MKGIAICGAPKAGKTTENPNAMHADDWLQVSHHYAVNKAVKEIRSGATVEGCAVVFALSRVGPALSEAHWYGKSRARLSPMQAKFARQCEREWRKVRSGLIVLGVKIIEK